MIRAVFVAAVVLVAVLVTPFALGNPAFNSADLLLILSPAAVLAIGWPRRSRRVAPRAVSEHYEAREGAGCPQPRTLASLEGGRPVSVTRRDVSLDVARAVLWHFGDRNLGIEPGHFISRLLVLASAADEENLEKLRVGWPEHIEAWEAVSRRPWGLDWLRGIVKADLDGAERGLDLGVFS